MMEPFVFGGYSVSESLFPTSDVLALRVCASRFVRQLVSLPGRSSGETQENAEERVELE